MSKIAFIIVTYNGEAYIERCIKSIFVFFPEIYTIVIDNNSKDKTRQILDTLKVDELICLNDNIGFGKANNIGIRQALKTNCEAFF